jgi:hypothetical protein
MSLLKHLNLFILIFFLASCSTSEENTHKKPLIPEKITFLFITQPHCPACDRLEETMALEGPKELLDNYFDIQKLYYGEKLPEGIMPPNGTPTVYFLGANNEILVEPMVGQKEEEGLMEYLEDALLEFKTTYHIDLIELHDKKRENNETNISTTTKL